MRGSVVAVVVRGAGEPEPARVWQDPSGPPNCYTLDEAYLRHLGIVQSGGWHIQNPLFDGYTNTLGDHPRARSTIAVAATLGEGCFGANGNDRAGNCAQGIFRQIGERVVPADPPLVS